MPYSHAAMLIMVVGFLVDGAVAGTWRFAEGHIELEPFEPLTAGVRRELGAEAERLAAFHTE